mmetsp:Transcript_3790/g.7266  ORF Transcript_3790/g.7266 Transcript_3790/m.7266 type:complete len:83 (+) Transcript_3790:218-466(+)
MTMMVRRQRDVQKRKTPFPIRRLPCRSDGTLLQLSQEPTNKERGDTMELSREIRRRESFVFDHPLCLGCFVVDAWQQQLCSS